MRSTTSFAASLTLFAFCACGGAASSLTDPATTDADTTSSPALGARRVFPADNPWNADVSAQPVDPASATLIASCGVRNLHPDFGSVYGIPYVLAGSATPRRPIAFDYADPRYHHLRDLQDAALDSLFLRCRQLIGEDDLNWSRTRSDFSFSSGMGMSHPSTPA